MLGTGVCSRATCVSPSLRAQVLTPSISGWDPTPPKQSNCRCLQLGGVVGGPDTKGRVGPRADTQGGGHGRIEPPGRGWTGPSLPAAVGAEPAGHLSLKLAVWRTGTQRHPLSGPVPQDTALGPAQGAASPHPAPAAAPRSERGPQKTSCSLRWEEGDSGEYPGGRQTRSPWEPGSRLQCRMSRGSKARARGWGWGLPGKGRTVAHWARPEFKCMLGWGQLRRYEAADLRGRRPRRWPSRPPQPPPGLVQEQSPTVAKSCWLQGPL